VVCEGRIVNTPSNKKNLPPFYNTANSTVVKSIFTYLATYKENEQGNGCP
jgi:hypothetical protein